jgi:hypothetical protein
VIAVKNGRGDKLGRSTKRVVGEDGYYRVKYEMLGIEFRRIA